MKCGYGVRRAGTSSLEDQFELKIGNTSSISKVMLDGENSGYRSWRAGRS